MTLHAELPAPTAAASTEAVMDQVRAQVPRYNPSETGEFRAGARGTQG